MHEAIRIALRERYSRTRKKRQTECRTAAWPRTPSSSSANATALIEGVGELGHAPSWVIFANAERSLPRIASGAVAFAKFAPLFFRQILILPPALVQFLVFFRWKFFHAFIALDCLRTLFGRQSDPLLHTLLDPLLTFRW